MLVLLTAHRRFTFRIALVQRTVRAVLPTYSTFLLKIIVNKLVLLFSSTHRVFMHTQFYPETE
jgi:hypothetical protein